MNTKLIDFVRDYYRTKEFIPLHSPYFGGQEKRYLLETIDSTFVSSVGSYVDKFEKDISVYTGASRAVATVNGTSALHVALKLVGVTKGDLVITQPLTFVATCNAINYCGAEPVFIDVDIENLGLSPTALERWLEEYTELDSDGVCRTLSDNKAVKACVPMHTFGHPVEVDKLIEVTSKWNIKIVEDAAESLGSLYRGKHTGTFGDVGITSFNGNKIITTGGGGMILTGHELGDRAKHLTTTAKKAHPYEYNHDEIGFNYRLPNLNAALGCAQLEQIEKFVEIKRDLASKYEQFFSDSSLKFIKEPKECRSNYWLNAVVCNDRDQRDKLLTVTNRNGVMTRPIWTLMNKLEMYKNCRHGDLSNSDWLEARVLNLPSGVNRI